MNLKYRAELKIGQFLPLIVMDRHRKHVHLGVRVRAQSSLNHRVDGTAKKNCFILWWYGCGQKLNNHGENGGLGTIFIEVVDKS